MCMSVARTLCRLLPRSSMRQRNEPTDTPGARYGEAWTPVAESKLTGPPRYLDVIHVQDLRDARRVPIDGDTKDTWAEWRSQDGNRKLVFLRSRGGRNAGSRRAATRRLTRIAATYHLT